MVSPAQWHASPQRGGAPASDAGTGEVRVPLSLFHVDQHMGDVELVLSRLEGEELLTGLRAALAASAVRKRPEAIR